MVVEQGPCAASRSLTMSDPHDGGEERRRERLARATIRRRRRLARQAIADRVLVHAELPSDRSVTQPPLV